MITTTLNRIREHDPCERGWAKLLCALRKTQPDNEPLSYGEIVRINGLDAALWACRAEPQHARAWRLFAVWCARQVQHLMQDQRSIAALDVAERHAHGEATDDELIAALAAAYDAYWNIPLDASLDASRIATRVAAWAASGSAEWYVARSASLAVALESCMDATRTAAFDAALAAAQDATPQTTPQIMQRAAWDAARDAQKTEFLRLCEQEISP